MVHAPLRVGSHDRVRLLHVFNEPASKTIRFILPSNQPPPLCSQPSSVTPRDKLPLKCKTHIQSVPKTYLAGWLLKHGRRLTYNMYTLYLWRGSRARFYTPYGFGSSDMNHVVAVQKLHLVNGKYTNYHDFCTLATNNIRRMEKNTAHELGHIRYQKMV